MRRLRHLLAACICVLAVLVSAAPAQSSIAASSCSDYRKAADPAQQAAYSAYLEAYADVSGESRERILGWLPFVAGARLAEGLPDDEDSLIEMADSRR